jgi:hypothetical protein
MCLPASALPAAAHASALHTASILGGMVRTIVMATRPINTALAYNPKQKEYYTFCDHMYKDYHISTRYTIGTEKVEKVSPYLPGLRARPFVLYPFGTL